MFYLFASMLACQASSFLTHLSQTPVWAPGSRKGFQDPFGSSLFLIVSCWVATPQSPPALWRACAAFYWVLWLHILYFRNWIQAYLFSCVLTDLPKLSKHTHTCSADSGNLLGSVLCLAAINWDNPLTTSRSCSHSSANLRPWNIC